MMENFEKDDTIFLDDTAEESENIIENEWKTNMHIAFLKQLLMNISVPETLQNMVDYGVSKLSDSEDEHLATYFFILSNLKNFSKVERDFFTDAMLYCEAPEYKSLTELKEQYKKIAPLHT